ncbi:hypothetical protein AVEN_109429-1 [Araneus ventricosus]|uniref:Uncharacterized protein n=1 Tax=Araneus ventricosus TaxID=182803 RepID=A0A4Y2NPD8_ARAVE|nr:hypothetical protein AVEN_109429-1 [Araneus ventricosus]
MISDRCHGSGEVLTFGTMRWTFLPVSPLSHSFCQSYVEMARSFFLRKLLGAGYCVVIPSKVAFFATRSAASLPACPACALIQPSLIFGELRRT